MSNDTKKIERIKALLAKAASTDHEAEAEAFFAKAYELMEKYQLDSTDLDKDDPLGNEKVAQRKGAAAPDWDFRLMFAVANYFGCKAIQIPDIDDLGYLAGHHMDLVGRESARVTAIEMHKYLVKTVRRLGREYAQTNTFERNKRDGLKLLNADAWSRRIGVALSSRLNELARKPEQAKTDVAKANALVTVDKVAALYNRLHPTQERLAAKLLERTTLPETLRKALVLTFRRSTARSSASHSRRV